METGVTKGQIITSLLSITVILAGLYVLFAYFGVTEVQSIAQAGWWAPALLVIAKAATLVIAPIGGSALYPLAGALFGFWKGVLFLFIGDMLGAVVSFYISRIFGRHLVEKLLGDDQKFLSRALRMMGTTKGFTVARVCFIALPEVSAYGAGLTRINFIPFVIIQSLVGLVPTILLAGVGSILTAGHWWVLPLALLLGTIIIPAGFFVFRNILNEWGETR